MAQGERADVPNVIVLITDESSSTASAQAVLEAFEAQCAGVKVFAIGTRSFGFNLTELALISSPPRLEWHQWWAPDDLRANNLDDIELMVDNELCRPEHGIASPPELSPRVHFARPDPTQPNSIHFV